MSESARPRMGVRTYGQMGSADPPGKNLMNN